MTSAGILLSALLCSFIFLPWSITVFLAVAAGVADPLLLIAGGMLADALYYAPDSSWPFYTLLACAAAPFLHFVRKSVKTSIITG